MNAIAHPWADTGRDPSLVASVPNRPRSTAPAARPEGATLVVIEADASWPSGAFRRESYPEPVLVLTQPANEAPAQLMSRVARLVAANEDAGRPIENAVMCLSTRNDEDAASARYLTARCLTSHMAANQRGSMALIGQVSHGTDEPHPAFLLADRLMVRLPPLVAVDVVLRSVQPRL